MHIYTLERPRSKNHSYGFHRVLTILDIFILIFLPPGLMLWLSPSTKKALLPVAIFFSSCIGLREIGRREDKGRDRNIHADTCRSISSLMKYTPAGLEWGFEPASLCDLCSW